MTDGLHYILQQFPPAFLSEVKFIKSANGVVYEDLSQIGARYVYYHHIYWTPAVGEGILPVTFVDQFGKTLFTNQSNGTTWAPLFYVKHSTLIKITSIPVVNFSVSYQYVISKDEVKVPSSQ